MLNHKIYPYFTPNLMRIRFILLVILLLAFFIPGRSQESDCLKTLKDAKEHYEQGLIDEIPSMLSACMASGFTRAQRIEAYKLIILAYLFDDDQYEAEKTMDEFLKKFPEYEVMPDDPVEFVYLLESYKTASVYSFNFFFGPTFSNPRITEVYSPQDITYTDISDKTGGGFQIGVGASRNVWKSFAMELDLIYSTHNYATSFNTEQAFSNNDISVSKSVAKEHVSKLDVPVTLSYEFGKGNINYFVRAGGLVGFVNKVRLSPVKDHTNLEQITENNIDVKTDRKHIYLAPVIGFGMQYKIPRGYLVLETRYQIGLQNFVVTKDRYAKPRLYGRYGLLDDNYKLNYLSINVGYYFSIYQSKKSRF